MTAPSIFIDNSIYNQKCWHLCMEIADYVFYTLFTVFSGIIGYKLLTAYQSKDIAIAEISKAGIENAELAELKETHANLSNAFRTLKSRYQRVRDDELDIDDLDIDLDDPDDTKLSKIAQGFGVPKNLAPLLDKKEFQESIVKILSKDPKPVLDLVNNFLVKKETTPNPQQTLQEAGI